MGPQPRTQSRRRGKKGGLQSDWRPSCESQMIVRFTQSGGYAGLLKGCELDTKSLSPTEAKTLEDLVQASALPASGEFLSKSSRDLRQYEISIEDGKSR